MYRDDNINYKNITNKEKIDFDNKCINLSNKRMEKIDYILNQNAKNRIIIVINSSEFKFANNDVIIFDNKKAKIIKHLDEMIQIEFENKNGSDCNKKWIDLQNNEFEIDKII